jgi:hypothetical protein
MTSLLRYARLALTALGITLAGVSASATTIVDTGTPFGGPNWNFSVSQYFAGEFSIAETYEIDSVQGYFSASEYLPGIPPGTVTIAVHSDGGSIPGDILHFATLNFVTEVPLDWYGVGALGWVLEPGTYWVSFRPEFDGGMPGTAPAPLQHYAQGNFDGVWFSEGKDDLGIGVRIEATLVPEPDFILILGAGIAGVVAHRRLMQVK